MVAAHIVVPDTNTLPQNYAVNTGLPFFTPDLRGHGDSEGDRGDCPGPEQVWRDIGSMVQHIRKTQNGPLFLGGHSSGAEVVLNYSSWENKTPVDAYVFLSPQLGHRSRTARKDRENPFVTVKVQYFVLNSMTIGLGFGHRAAVIFNYPPEVLANDTGMVGSNTVNMANALTPLDPEGQFEELDQPFGMWIGSKDELMVPERSLTTLIWLIMYTKSQKPKYWQAKNT